MNRLLPCGIAWLFAVAILAAVHGQAPSDDEKTLRSAGLPTDGPALLAIRPQAHPHGGNAKES